MTPITFTDEPTSSSADTNLAPTTPPMSAGPNPFFAPDRPDVAQTESPLSPPLAPAPSLVRPTVEVTVKEERGWLRRMFRWFVVKPYQFACLFVLLGVVSIVPLLQFAAFGYLLEVAGRTARTGRFRDSISKLSEASKLVTAGIAIYLVSLPAVLLGSWSNSAAWIVANNPSTPLLRFSAIAVSCLGMVYLLWAWARGGRIRDYLWPLQFAFCVKDFGHRFGKRHINGSGNSSVDLKHHVCFGWDYAAPSALSCGLVFLPRC